MKYIKEFKEFNNKVNEELYPFGTHPDSGKRLSFDELLEDPDFQSINVNLMDEDGFDKFKNEFGSNNSLSYEIDGSSLLIYYTDERILHDLLYSIQNLGADEITEEGDHIRLWFD